MSTLRSQASIDILISGTYPYFWPIEKHGLVKYYQSPFKKALRVSTMTGLELVVDGLARTGSPWTEEPGFLTGENFHDFPQSPNADNPASLPSRKRSFSTTPWNQIHSVQIPFKTIQDNKIKWPSDFSGPHIYSRIHDDKIHSRTIHLDQQSFTLSYY